MIVVVRLSIFILDVLIALFNDPLRHMNQSISMFSWSEKTGAFWESITDINCEKHVPCSFTHPIIENILKR